MKVFQTAALLVFAGLLCAPVRAQSNIQENKDAQTQLKSERKADKAQAKADKKDERKALKSHKVKKADKQQDKADRAAGNVPPQ